MLAEAGGRPLAALPGLDDAGRPGFLCVLRAGDLLSPDALLEAALASGLDRGAELLYGDERRAEPVSGRMAPFFKPDWSPDLLLSTNYIGRPWFAAAGLVARAGLTALGLRRHGEWDAVLRLTEQAGGIRHIPRLLAERDEPEPDTVAQDRAALKRMILRRGIAARVEPGCLPHVHRLRRAVQATGLVSIIIPTRASRGLVKTTIETIRANTRYPRIEIVAIDNIPDSQVAWKIWLQQHADKIVRDAEAFNWSRFNNRARGGGDRRVPAVPERRYRGDATPTGWTRCSSTRSGRRSAWSGRNCSIPTARCSTRGCSLPRGNARHAFRFAAADDPGYFGLALHAAQRHRRDRRLLAGARAATSRPSAGSTRSHEMVNNDLDFCLRAVARGLAVVFTPHAR